jgi:hypothetical protein
VVQEVVEDWEDECGHGHSMLGSEDSSQKIWLTSQIANKEHCNADIYIPCIQDHALRWFLVWSSSDWLHSIHYSVVASVVALCAQSRHSGSKSRDAFLEEGALMIFL